MYTVYNPTRLHKPKYYSIYSLSLEILLDITGNHTDHIDCGYHNPVKVVSFSFNALSKISEYKRLS